MTVREMIHQRERETLAPWAARSEESRGRVVPELPCPIRTDFQRDRDRIVHCRAFRRLAHKTQVFILPGHDHIRTRLTHTLEVAQIAKTLARALSLNEDLTEAIALAHDLGHTPFGHAGEWSLNEAVQQRSPSLRFHHSEQSLRVVDVLERGGQGLNLTWEVREGILGHTKGRKDLASTTSGQGALEGQAVKLSDRIAYVNHDLEDAIRARVLEESDVPSRLLEVLGHTHSQRIGVVVADIIQGSLGGPELRISDPIVQALNDLKEFLFDRVYTPKTERDDRRVHTVVHGLFNFYCDQSLQQTSSSTLTMEKEMAEGTDMAGGARITEDELLAPGVQSALEWSGALHSSGSGTEEADQASIPPQVTVPPQVTTACRSACDYVAGMTDRFAVQRYMELFVPDSAKFVEG